jgi:hypothetical protein
LTAVKARIARAAATDNETISFGLRPIIVVESETKKKKRTFAPVYPIWHSMHVVTFMSNLLSEISTCAIINHRLYSYARLWQSLVLYIWHILFFIYIYICCYFNWWRCPKDTCFSDLLLTAESVDNGGLRLCTVVLILSLCLYTCGRQKKIIERQKRPCKKDIHHWITDLYCSLFLLTFHHCSLDWCRCNHWYNNA